MKPLTPASPHVIMMVGIPGSGKSTFAEQFADTFQALLLNRTKLQNQLQLTTEYVDTLADIMLKEFMKMKRTIVLEGNLDTKEYRDELAKYFKKKGYRPLIVWVQTDTNEAHRRAVKPYPYGSGLSESEFSEKVTAFEAPVAKEKPVVISGKHTYATQLKVVLKQIALNTRAAHANATPSVPVSVQSRGRGSSAR